jgi:hypothetical protein
MAIGMSFQTLQAFPKTHHRVAASRGSAVSHFYPKGEELREEYLMSLSDLVKVLKERGRFDLTTKFVASQSERARQVWEQHLRACIGCYRQVKPHSLMHWAPRRFLFYRELVCLTGCECLLAPAPTG